jgi:hypothetical protein
VTKGRSVDLAVGLRKNGIGPDRDDLVAADGDGRLHDVHARDDLAAADDDIDPRRAHR